MELLLDGAETGTHPGSVVKLWSAGLFDCVAEELQCVLVAVKDTEDFEMGGCAVVPFDCVAYATLPGYAGYKSVQHLVSVVHLIEDFVLRV